MMIVVLGMELSVTTLAAMFLSSIFKVHAQTTTAKYWVLVSVGKLQWISGLLVLQYLDLSCVNLSQAYDWLQVTSMLSSLAELCLLNCQLHPFSSFLGPNFTSLVVLDLYFNYFNPLMPNWLFGLTSLDSLALCYCDFSGPIPSGLQNMTSLRDLDPSWNHFNSTIPTWLYNFKGLKSLKLGGNDLQGLILGDIGNLSSIIHIDLSSNKIEGRIPRSMGTLCNTKVLHLAFNSIVGPLPWSIRRMSSLASLYLDNNQLNGTIPESLGNLTKLEILGHVIWVQHFPIGFNHKRNFQKRTFPLVEFHIPFLLGFGIFLQELII
ncbi:hypothetical protein ACSBR2_037040 [Camellia fascicularis]